MSPFVLIAGPIALLALPWLILPRIGERAEIRGSLRFLWWLNRLYCALWHRLVVENAAPLTEHGPALLISNHTCGVDHLILQAGCRRLLGFMIAQEYYDYPLYHPFCKRTGCIPVKRDGRDQTAIRAALRALKDGRVLPIFPEGRINPSSGREFHDAKPGAAYIALRANVPVIPAYIRGTPPTNNIVTSLSTPSHARVVFGPPIDLADLRRSGEKHDHERERAQLARATERMMEAIRDLRDRSLEGSSRESSPLP